MSRPAPSSCSRTRRARRSACSPAEPSTTEAPLIGAALVAFAPTVDLDASHAFYGGVLGLRRVEAGAFANAYDAGGTSLRVTRVERRADAAYTVLGWRVTDFDAAVDLLRAAGVAFTRYPALDQDDHDAWTSPSGARIAWFTDPDGNVLSLQG